MNVALILPNYSLARDTHARYLGMFHFGGDSHSGAVARGPLRLLRKAIS